MKFSLERGKNTASDDVDGFVKKTAGLLGCKDDDVNSAVRYLEKICPIPSDGNTPDFGGGSQHHLRDFAHHPTIAGLMFSLLTQFTGKSYGTDKIGEFIFAEVPEKSKKLIGRNVPEKIFNATVIWFFHLESDMAGSGSTAGFSGGMGIPGPILAIAKELSVLPLFKKLQINEYTLSLFLSKFDLRAELGMVDESVKEMIPVIANECFVRAFYIIRSFAVECRTNQVHSLDEMKKVKWQKLMPSKNPSFNRMITIATGVFTTLDVADAVIIQKNWVSVNCAGVGRFAVAIGGEITWALKARDVRKICSSVLTQLKF